MPSREEIIEYIRSSLLTKYPNKVTQIYGIGSFFFSSLPVKTPIDVVVLLSDTTDVPRKDYTTALFEDIDWQGLKLRFMYATLSTYLHRNEFEQSSFSNYVWSIRAMKHQSELLYGQDIRDRLPELHYTSADYEKICLNAMYHLEGSVTRYNQPDPQRLWKGLIKIAFFISVVEEPDSNYHSVESLIVKMQEYADQSIIQTDFINILTDAYQKRLNNTFPTNLTEYVAYRKQCVRMILKEIPRHVNGMDWERLRSLLLRGFTDSRNGFVGLVMIGDELYQRRY